MIFREAPLPGAFVVEPERHDDTRGFFARTFSVDEFAERGLPINLVEQSVAWNRSSGTVRGMHFQFPPHAEGKLVRCTRGAIHDVIVDLRPESASFASSFAIRLDFDNHLALYVPERFAHGYQVLAPDTEVAYGMTARYAPSASAGIRYDDETIAIDWPLPVETVSDRDLALPVLADVRGELIRRLSI
jgi:dTDP-4-dehydrorhamnose 3,5-epimerase